VRPRQAALLGMLGMLGFEAPTRFFQTWLFGGWAMTRRRS